MARQAAKMPVPISSQDIRRVGYTSSVGDVRMCCV